MNKIQAITRLSNQQSIISELKKYTRFSPQYKKWYRDTEIAIQQIFGENTRHIHDFKNIRFSLNAFSNYTPDSDFDKRFFEGLADAHSIIQSFIDEIVEYWNETQETHEIQDADAALAAIEKICTRFHLVYLQFIHRYSKRLSFLINDEYDTQDLLHALLLLEFNDIRAEEWTPSYAGGSSRVDFLLKQEQIVIEVKKTRDNLGAKELGDQLLIDIQRYIKHPDCKKLICFIYDPDLRISNPIGFENDLNGQKDGLLIKTIITPKGL